MAWMDDPGPAYDAARWMIENGPWLLDAARDPANLPTAVGVGALTAGAGALTIKGASAGYQGAQRLAAGPGEVVLGHRRGGAADRLLNPLVTMSRRDRESGLLVLGPTGSGKTSFFEPIAVQDLGHGSNVFVLEIFGNLGTSLPPYAGAMNVPAFVFDASDSSSSLRWNFLSGRSKEEVAERAAAVMETITDDPYYGESNYAVTYNFVSLAWDFARARRRHPDLELVELLLTDRTFLEKVLESTRTDRRTRVWFQQDYLSWNDRTRSERTDGIRNRLSKLLSNPAARHSLCPQTGDEVLDLREALSYPGALVVMRFPVAALGSAPARTAAAMAFRTMQDITYERGFGPEGGAWPLSNFLDEAHTLVGRGTKAALEYTGDWITLVRKHRVANTVAFQGYDVLPEALGGVFETNLRSLVVAGGLGSRDARRVQEAFGREEVYVEDERHTYGPGGHSRSRGRRRAEQYRMSMDDLRLTELGMWRAMLLKNGNLQKPVTFKSSRLPSARRFARSWGARRARARRETR